MATMTTIRHTVTYTTARSEYHECRQEYTTTLDRKRTLTYAGAQRILRKQYRDPSLLVGRVKTAIVER